MGICSEENVALYVYGYVLYGFRTCIYAYLYDCRTLDPFSIRTYTRSCVLHFPRTPFMIHLDMPFSMPMNTVPKHTNIFLQIIYLLSSFRPRTPTKVLVYVIEWNRSDSIRHKFCTTGRRITAKLCHINTLHREY